MPYHTEQAAGDLFGAGSLERTRSPLFAPVAAGAGTSIGERYRRLLEQTKVRQGALASLASARQSEISLERGGRELEAMRAESDVYDELDAISYWDKDLANKLAPFQELAGYNERIQRALTAKTTRGGQYQTRMAGYTKSAIGAGIRDDEDKNTTNLTDNIQEASNLLRGNKFPEFVRRMEMNNYNAAILNDMRDVDQQLRVAREKAGITSQAAEVAEWKQINKDIRTTKGLYPHYLTKNPGHASFFNFGASTDSYVHFTTRLKKPTAAGGEGQEGPPAAAASITFNDVTGKIDKSAPTELVISNPLESMTLDVVKNSFRGFAKELTSVESVNKWMEDEVRRAKDEAEGALKQKRGEKDDAFDTRKSKARGKITREKLIKEGRIPTSAFLRGSAAALDLRPISSVVSEKDAAKMLESGETQSNLQLYDVVMNDWYESVAAAALNAGSGPEGRAAFIARFNRPDQEVFLEQLRESITELAKSSKLGDSGQARMLDSFYNNLEEFVSGKGGRRTAGMLGGIYDLVTRLRAKSAVHDSYTGSVGFNLHNSPKIMDNNKFALEYYKQQDPEGYAELVKKHKKKTGTEEETTGGEVKSSDVMKKRFRHILTPEDQ